MWEPGEGVARIHRAVRAWAVVAAAELVPRARNLGEH